MRIRLFIAILALVLCAIAVRANRPIVIKDSEAIQYVGKEVEVQGCVVCVMTSPLGTTFINFGGEYPNQTFAGFIAAVSRIATDQRLTMIQGKIISITGTIQLRDGKPEIEIVSPDQIKVLGSQTEAKHSINFSPQKQRISHRQRNAEKMQLMLGAETMLSWRSRSKSRPLHGSHETPQNIRNYESFKGPDRTVT